MTTDNEALPPLPLTLQFSADYLRSYMEGEPGEARRHLEKLIAALSASPQAPQVPAMNIAGAAQMPTTSGIGWVSSCGCSGAEQYIGGQLVRSEHKCAAHREASSQAPAAQPVAFTSQHQVEELRARRAGFAGRPDYLYAHAEPGGIYTVPLYAAPPAQPQQAAEYPHREHWVAIAKAAEAIEASSNCGPEQAAEFCRAIDRLSAALMGD